MRKREIPFQFDMAVDFFEKGDAGKKRRRIGGIASIETEDQQGEVLLQRGLDFTPFLKNGWFNDNHSKDTTGIVGFPDNQGVRYFEKGEKLPSGKIATAAGHWVEGYLLDTPRANEIWELGQALHQTDRRLGFSVEGKIKQRIGPESKTVAKALVRNVAITNCPVNENAQMEVLVKSLAAVEQTEDDYLESLGLTKALTVGSPPADHSAPEGPKVGEEAGQILSKESLEDDETKDEKDEEDEDKDEDTEENGDDTEKSLTKSEAFAWARARLPNAKPEIIERFLQLTRVLKTTGQL